MAPLVQHSTHLLAGTQENFCAGRDCGVGSLDPVACWLCPCAAFWSRCTARLSLFVLVAQDDPQVQAIASLMISHAVLPTGVHSSITRRGVLKGRRCPLAFRMPVSLMLDRRGDIDAEFGLVDLACGFSVRSGGSAWFQCALWLPVVPHGSSSVELDPSGDRSTGISDTAASHATSATAASLAAAAGSLVPSFSR